MKMRNLKNIYCGLVLAFSACSEQSERVQNSDERLYADATDLKEFLESADPFPHWRELTIKSKPSGLYIFFEGNIVGKTPLTLSGSQMKELGILGYWAAYKEEKMWQSWDINSDETGVSIKTPMSEDTKTIEFRAEKKGPSLEFDGGLAWSNDSGGENYSIGDRRERGYVVIAKDSTFTAHFDYLIEDL